MTRLWQPATLCLILVAAWIALAAWQYREYGHEREQVQQALARQSDAIMNALVGGIQSHRRLGRFVQDQIQGALDELVKSEDVLAVAITDPAAAPILLAGETRLLEALPPVPPGNYWDPAGFRHVAPFTLAPIEAGPGWGGGRGPGRGRARTADANNSADEGPLARGGQFVATLLLNRQTADAQCRAAARLRIFVTAAGAVVLICVAVAWWATVRLLDARASAKLLETEARHLGELSQAAAGLAHETRNPLGLIRGWSQRLAASGLKSPEEQHRAEAIVEECDRVTARINQFFAFAKPCRPSLGPVEPDAMVDQLAVLLEPDLEAKNLHLNRPVCSRRQTIEADAELLRQVLFNLLQNAVQFSPDGGAIDVSVSLGGGGGQIDVADRGPGVAADAVDALFTPYYTTRSGGTGLGLAIVRRIASAHGWRVEYHARPGGGAVFRLHLTK